MTVYERVWKFFLTFWRPGQRFPWPLCYVFVTDNICFDCDWDVNYSLVVRWNSPGKSWLWVDVLGMAINYYDTIRLGAILKAKLLNGCYQQLCCIWWFSASLLLISLDNLRCCVCRAWSNLADIQCTWGAHLSNSWVFCFHFSYTATGRKAEPIFTSYVSVG